MDEENNMQTHHDSEHMSEMAKDFMAELKSRALVSELKETAKITAGLAGEKSLCEFDSYNGVHVRQLPDDQQGILRISIGGGDATPVKLNYCTIRGNPKDCIHLIRKALAALESGFQS